MRSYLLFFNILICLENKGDLVMLNRYDDMVFSSFSTPLWMYCTSSLGRGEGSRATARDRRASISQSIL